MKRLRQSKRKHSAKLSWKLLVVFFVVCLVGIFAGIYNNAVVKATEIQKYQALIRGLSGSNGTNRTLILFSNNAEMRYGGGFIGSVGYIEARQGKKLVIDPIRSVYYYDHRVEGKDELLESATPELLPLMPYITLRDSGVDLDWQRNAARAARLFELESGKKVDTVAMMTPNVIKGLLSVTGPVYLKDYGFAVTSDNFLEKVQLEVEAGDDKQAGKDPKTILGVLANTLLKQLFEQGSVQDVTKYTDLLSKMAAQKQLALYSRDAKVQESLALAGIDGGLAPVEGDYLMVAEANIGANKSSPYMKQNINRKLVVDAAGRATVELVIERKHTGQYLHQYVDPHDGRTKWLVGVNASYIKLALPVGSKILSRDFDLSRGVYTESGRDVVTFFSGLEPGSATTYKLTYELPFRYSMSSEVVIRSFLEKPIGGFAQTVSHVVELPADYRLAEGDLPKNVQLESDLGSRLVYRRR
jgi:hypothetical protein